MKTSAVTLIVLTIFGVIGNCAAFIWPWKNTEDNSQQVHNEKIHNPKDPAPSLGSEEADSLHSAAARGDILLLERLLVDGFDVNQKDFNGWQPIHEAVKHANVDIVKLLVKHGAQIGEKTSVGGTPLWWSIHQNGEQHPVSKYLRSIGAQYEGDIRLVELHHDDEDTEGSTELHMFASEGDSAAVRDILRKHRHLLNAVDANGWQPLHEAVQAGHLDMVKLLVRSGADLNTVTVKGGSPLWWSRRLHGLNHPVSLFLESVGAMEEQTEENE